MTSRRAPRREFLLNRRIVQIEIGTLVAGTSLRGQFEERIVGIVDEVKNAPDVILFIDEIHTIVGAGDYDRQQPGRRQHPQAGAGARRDRLHRRDDPRGISQGDRPRPGAGSPLPHDRHSASRASARRWSWWSKSISATKSITRSQFCPKRAKRQCGSRIATCRDRRLPDKALDLLDEACARLVIQTQ